MHSSAVIQLTEQLELRAQPQKERWETFSPGLLNQVGKQIWGDRPRRLVAATGHRIVCATCPRRRGSAANEARIWLRRC